MRTHPRVSVAATAIVRFLVAGNYIGAAVPLYIRECRALRGDELIGAFALADKRLWQRHGIDLERLNNRNFFAALEEQKYGD